MSIFERSALLLGEDSITRLANARVLLFGVGGVGSYTAEALARAGVGHLTLVDNDTVAESNLNRQLVALHSTLGQNKAAVAAARAKDINPAIDVRPIGMFYLPENAHELPFDGYDYIVDAIDTMSAKINIICRAYEKNIPIISAMGCGNKLDPTRFMVTDLFKTTTDPVARVLRSELRKRGVPRLKVVYSTEPARTPCLPQDAPAPAPGRRQTPGSVSFVPGAAGLILAGEVVRDLTGVR